MTSFAGWPWPSPRNTPGRRDGWGSAILAVHRVCGWRQALGRRLSIDRRAQATYSAITISNDKPID